MNFASYEFWSQLISCVLVSALVLAVLNRVRPNLVALAGKLCLLGTALSLLAAESPLTLGAFLWVVISGWLAVRLFAGSRLVDKIGLIVLLGLQLAPLFYFKYWDFVFNEVFGLGLKVPSTLIPMGLSFYTFQTIGFWVDTKKDSLKCPSFLDFLNFCSFFPQIVAGPIERRNHLLPQIEKFRFVIDRREIEPALLWIVLGLFYKLVLADNLGVIIGALRIDPTNAWHVWVECVTFGLRIYFDFAGYSFVALGLGLLFGIRLTLNFRSPYWSLSLREFWRNWHITLSGWLRDYVYMPLGGGRSRRWWLNILIVFVVSGIWHGAGWGFLIWGGLHGIGVIVSGWETKPKLPKFLAWLVTLAYSMGAWLFFFERDSGLMWTKARTMLHPSSYGVESVRELKLLFGSASDLVTFAMILTLGLGVLLAEGWDKKSDCVPYQSLRNPILAGVFVALIVLLAPAEESSFIYFNF